MSDYTLKNGEPTCEGCKSPLFCSTEGFCNIKSWENAKGKKFELCKDCQTPLYCEYVPGRGECAIDLGMKRMKKCFHALLRRVKRRKRLHWGTWAIKIAAKTSASDLSRAPFQCLDGITPVLIAHDATAAAKHP